jgi:hypothetical protein
VGAAGPYGSFGDGSTSAAYFSGASSLVASHHAPSSHAPSSHAPSPHASFSPASSNPASSHAASVNHPSPARAKLEPPAAFSDPKSHQGESGPRSQVQGEKGAAWPTIAPAPFASSRSIHKAAPTTLAAPTSTSTSSSAAPKRASTERTSVAPIPGLVKLFLGCVKAGALEAGNRDGWAWARDVDRRFQERAEQGVGDSYTLALERGLVESRRHEGSNQAQVRIVGFRPDQPGQRDKHGKPGVSTKTEVSEWERTLGDDRATGQVPSKAHGPSKAGGQAPARSGASAATAGTDMAPLKSGPSSVPPPGPSDPSKAVTDRVSELSLRYNKGDPYGWVLASTAGALLTKETSFRLKDILPDALASGAVEKRGFGATIELRVPGGERDRGAKAQGTDTGTKGTKVKGSNADTEAGGTKSTSTGTNAGTNTGTNAGTKSKAGSTQDASWPSLPDTKPLDPEPLGVDEAVDILVEIIKTGVFEAASAGEGAGKVDGGSEGGGEDDSDGSFSDLGATRAWRSLSEVAARFLDKTGHDVALALAGAEKAGIVERKGERPDAPLRLSEAFFEDENGTLKSDPKGKGPKVKGPTGTKN